MKGKDIKAANVDGVFFAVDNGEVGIDRREVKAKVLDVGVKRSHGQARDGVRVRWEHAFERWGRIVPAGSESVVPAVHVKGVWRPDDEARYLALLEAERVVASVEAVMVSYGLQPDSGYPWGAKIGYGQRVEATVDGVGLQRLLAVFSTSDKAEHFTIALLAERGDENANRVIADMDPIERVRFNDVAGLLGLMMIPAAVS
jgi:hypothetical protein